MSGLNTMEGDQVNFEIQDISHVDLDSQEVEVASSSSSLNVGRVVKMPVVSSKKTSKASTSSSLNNMPNLLPLGKVGPALLRNSRRFLGPDYARSPSYFGGQTSTMVSDKLMSSTGHYAKPPAVVTQPVVSTNTVAANSSSPGFLQHAVLLDENGEPTNEVVVLSQNGSGEYSIVERNKEHEESEFDANLIPKVEEEDLFQQQQGQTIIICQDNDPNQFQHFEQDEDGNLIQVEASLPFQMDDGTIYFDDSTYEASSSNFFLTESPRVPKSKRKSSKKPLQVIIGADGKPLKKKGQTELKCMEKGCVMACYNVSELRKHLTISHGFTFDEEIVSFPGDDEFKNWRETYERERMVSFIYRGGTKKVAKDQAVTYLICHRSGHYKPTMSNESLRKRKLKPQGSCKMGGYCTAGIKLVKNTETGFVKMEICHTHYGHPLDSEAIPHLRVTPTLRKIILTKFKAGLTFTEVLAYIHHNPDRLEGLRLVDRRAVRNIYDTWKHPNRRSRQVQKDIDELSQEELKLKPELMSLSDILAYGDSGSQNSQIDLLGEEEQKPDTELVLPELKLVDKANILEPDVPILKKRPKRGKEAAAEGTPALIPGILDSPTSSQAERTKEKPKPLSKKKLNTPLEPQGTREKPKPLSKKKLITQTEPEQEQEIWLGQTKERPKPLLKKKPDIPTDQEVDKEKPKPPLKKKPDIPTELEVNKEKPRPLSKKKPNTQTPSEPSIAESPKNNYGLRPKRNVQVFKAAPKSKRTLVIETESEEHSEIAESEPKRKKSKTIMPGAETNSPEPKKSVNTTVTPKSDPKKSFDIKKTKEEQKKPVKAAKKGSKKLIKDPLEWSQDELVEVPPPPPMIISEVLERAIEKLQNHGDAGPTVLLYKPLGVSSKTDTKRELRKDDFCVVLQTPVQRQLLQMFPNIIAFDVIEAAKSPQEHLKLAFLMVLDEYRESIPVAWLLTNSLDSRILTSFFKAIKSECGELKTKYLMTPRLSDASKMWVSVFSDDPKIVQNDIEVRRDLKTLVWKEFSTDRGRREVWELVESFVIERVPDNLDISNLEEKFEPLLDKLPHSGEFVEKLERDWLSRVQEWAMCFRYGSSINIMGVSNSFNKLRKFIHFKGTKNLNENFEHILKIGYDKCFLRSKRMFKGDQKFSQFLDQITIQHLKARTLKDVSVVNSPVSEDTWIVSESDDSTYVVSRVNSPCDCRLLCKYCKVCVHTYTCTCNDFVTSQIMCVHVHFTHCDRNQVVDEPELLVGDPPFEDETNCAFGKIETSGTEENPGAVINIEAVLKAAGLFHRSDGLQPDQIVSITDADTHTVLYESTPGNIHINEEYNAIDNEIREATSHIEERPPQEEQSSGSEMLQ